MEKLPEGSKTPPCSPVPWLGAHSPTRIWEVPALFSCTDQIIGSQGCWGLGPECKPDCRSGKAKLGKAEQIAWASEELPGSVRS